MSTEELRLFIRARAKHAFLHTLPFWVAVALLALSMNGIACAASSAQCVDRSAMMMTLGMFVVPLVMTMYQMIVPSTEELHLKRDCILAALVVGFPMGLIGFAVLLEKAFH
jgi:hypothetical protein